MIQYPDVLLIQFATARPGGTGHHSDQNGWQKKISPPRLNLHHMSMYQFASLVIISYRPRNLVKQGDKVLGSVCLSVCPDPRGVVGFLVRPNTSV